MPIRVETDGAVAHLILDRPDKRNALSPELLRALISTCSELADDKEIRVVLLRAQGEAFSAGADLLEMLPELTGPDAHAAADLGRRAALALEGLPVPTIALVQGACVGGGVVLASACDIRLAGADARFRVPEIALGVPLAWGGCTRLAALVGPTQAADLVMSCRWFDAAEALQIGFVSRVLPHDEALAAAEQLASEIAACPRGPLAWTRQQLARFRAGEPRDELDADALLRALQDPETQAAAQRYLAAQLSGGE